MTLDRIAILLLAIAMTFSVIQRVGNTDAILVNMDLNLRALNIVKNNQERIEVLENDRAR